MKTQAPRRSKPQGAFLFIIIRRSKFFYFSYCVFFAKASYVNYLVELFKPCCIMKQTLSLIEVRFQDHFTSGVVSDWSDWTSLYAFETKEDANNEVFKLRDEELEKFGAWSLETVHSRMFMLHDYRVVDLPVF